MPDDPKEIAAYLVREVGLETAVEDVTAEIRAANQYNDFYVLSVWREVRRTLKEWKERPD